MCKNFIKVFITIIMIFSICFSFTIPSFADYSITQLTETRDDDLYPQINRSEKVVSAINPGNDGEIFFYDGTTITQLTNNGYDDYNPQLIAVVINMFRLPDYLTVTI